VSLLTYSMCNSVDCSLFNHSGVDYNLQYSITEFFTWDTMLSSVSMTLAFVDWTCSYDDTVWHGLWIQIV
jgi:hypothetical protein